MPRITYHQTLERTVEVEVTDAELATLRSVGPMDDQQLTDVAAVREQVIARALQTIDDQHLQPEFVGAVALDTDNARELFDV